MNKLLLCLITVGLANIGAWFQHQGQYLDKFDWMKNPWFPFLICAPLGLLFWKSTQYSYEYFGQFWNVRLIGFGFGTIIFGLMTWGILNEAPTLKTIICLLLAACIVLIQVTNIIK